MTPPTVVDVWVDGASTFTALPGLRPRLRVETQHADLHVLVPISVAPSMQVAVLARMRAAIDDLIESIDVSAPVVEAVGSL